MLTFHGNQQLSEP